MLRTTISRSFNRTSITTSALSSIRSTCSSATQLVSRSPRAQASALIPYIPRAHTPQTHRFTTSANKLLNTEKEEARLAAATLVPHPEEVSSESSVRHIIERDEKREDDVDMLAGVKSDIRTIKETFNLSAVPEKAYYIGLAGVLPYLATSVSTVYLAWDINYATAHGAGFLLSGQNAELLLHIIEPLQIGYGAVIISFLGAIHWGLEWARYGNQTSNRRYAIGVIAPAVAWPTLLLPVEYALISQFLAFTMLYYSDARATRRGLAPGWYNTYRFVLTFIVGSSIVLSLIGRGQIREQLGERVSPADSMARLTAGVDWEKLEAEERERLKREEAEGGEGEEEEEAEDEEGAEGEGEKDESEGEKQ
ncbi:MAG: hypothetical protein M1829_003290 [Trizodia sp. TS-e1964]|nr:MAG: hypothetical protein M1829_003290 [Trizodia sp. TS-e1964]